MISDDTTLVKPIFDDCRKGFATHKTKSIHFRKTQLRNMLRGLAEMQKKFHLALQADLNASEGTSKLYSTKISFMEIEDTLQNIDKWAKPRSVDTPLVVGPAKSYIVPEPYGTVLVISAWNYPVYTALPPVAQAIAAGNAVILKPSEMAAHSSKVLKQFFEQYLDSSTYRVIEGGPKVATLLTTLPFDLIIFTGSPEKGRLIAKAAAENLTPCILELGGQSPTVVDESANIENAALRIAQGRFLNAGQTCVACDYVLVHENVKDKFLDKLKLVTEQFFTKDAQKSNDYVKIINEGHTKRIENLLKDHGGKVVYGGQVDVPNRYVSPTIIDGPRIDSSLMTEEIFGPVLPIITFKKFDDVITFINQRPKPLALYYFGSTYSKNQQRIIDETSAGAVGINEACFHLLNPNLPFGGVGNSGMGAYHGVHGFNNCSHLKPIFNKATINFFPFSARYPPYTSGKQSLMSTLMDYTNHNQSKILKALSSTILIAFVAQYYNKQLLQGAQYVSDEITKKLSQL